MPPWRTMMKSDNLTAADLWDEREGKYLNFVLQIDSVKAGTVVGEGGRERGMPFVTFARAKKPLGLNSTNARTISTIVGSEDVNRWKGQWIELFVTKTKMGKDVVDCIRVAPTAPKPPEQAPAKEPARG